MAEFPENVRNPLNDKGVGSPGRIRTSNISVNSRRIQNLNALFGVAYRERRRFSVPQLGYLGYEKDKMIAASVKAR
jgi:hypothetical protein